jgi:hypothetical protein
MLLRAREWKLDLLLKVRGRPFGTPVWQESRGPTEKEPTGIPESRILDLSLFLVRINNVAKFPRLGWGSKEYQIRSWASWEFG